MGSRDFVMIDTQNVTNPLRLQIISFLIQHMYHCGKVQGKFSDKFGRSLSLVGELFPFTFPYRKYCQYHSLYLVKVSGGPCTIPPDEVLLQVAVKVPVHAFYCPMHSGYCIQPPGTSVKTGDIEPPLGRFLTIRFSFRCSPYFDNRQISIPAHVYRSNRCHNDKPSAFVFLRAKAHLSKADKTQIRFGYGEDRERWFGRGIQTASYFRIIFVR